MIRAVLDANVLTAMFPATTGTLLDLRRRWEAGLFVIVYSDYIVSEVERAWSKPYWTSRYPRHASAEALALLSDLAERIQLHIKVTGVAAHRQDDLVLSAAVSAAAALLITGDHQLLELRRYAGVRLINPRQFVDLLNRL